MTARYIAIDWGSTNLRAWLYQGDKCLESRQSEAGVTRLNGKSPDAVLAEVTTHWRDSATPVVMAGMIGSNVGWQNAPYLPGRFLVQWSKGKTLNVLLFPGPEEAGGSQEMVAGFRQAIKGSAINIVDIAWGDNDIEVQRNLLQEMLERHPDANVVAGSAIAAEAAMGEGRNLTTPLTIVSFYLTHQVYRGLKRGHILMALSDQMAWQGELAITQSIKVLQGQPVPENISPPVLILTHNNADSARVRRSLSPPGFRPVYLYQYTSEAKK